MNIDALIGMCVGLLIGLNAGIISSYFIWRSFIDGNQIYR